MLFGDKKRRKTEKEGFGGDCVLQGYLDYLQTMKALKEVKRPIREAEGIIEATSRKGKLRGASSIMDLILL